MSARRKVHGLDATIERKQGRLRRQLTKISGRRPVPETPVGEIRILTEEA